MYGPDMVAARVDQLLAAPAFAKALPSAQWLLTDYPVSDCQWMTKQLDRLWDPDRATQTRAFTAEEQEFVTHERLRGKLDYPYWAERYSYITHPAKGLASLYPLWNSQRHFLARIGQEEWKRHQVRHPDGLLANVLKARQLGLSTLCQSILAHRITTQSYTKAMIASDVPANSGSQGLFGLLELTIEHVPWWLKPAERSHRQNEGILFDNHSNVIVESGLSMKGALQEDGGSQGQIGRSRTIQMAHISEVSTWRNPSQLDDALLPAIPQTPRTFCAFESTAKGYNWWYDHWKAADSGHHPRFINVFIPWYIEPDKYWLPVPADWTPDEGLVKYSDAIFEDSIRWLGHRHRLTPEQLYWYACSRRAAEAKGDAGLAKFLEEFPARAEEAFQFSGRSIFSPMLLDRLRRERRPVRDLWEVRPASELLQRPGHRDVARMGERQA